LKRKYIYPALIILVSIIFYYLERSVDIKRDTPDTIEKNAKTNFFYLPTSTTGSIITHNFYTLSYSEKHEQAEWVAYELKKSHLQKKDFKRPYFEIDNKVKTTSANWKNYRKSGYDRGHLCPAGDRSFSYDAFEETFLTSNISPQNHDFNAGIWNELEQKTRYWAKRYDGVYVVTGGVLENGLKSIGYESVSIPNYFYKIILDNSSETVKMIAFLIPNKPTHQSLKSFVVPVDRIEKLTGIDFFPKLDDALENGLERLAQTRQWKF